MASYLRHNPKSKVIIYWSEHLKKAVDKCKDLKGSTRREYLVCNKQGNKYTSDGFSTLWQRAIKSAIEQRIVDEPFRFHDIRRKALTDAERSQGREFARQLANHTQQSTTDIYISGRRPITPLK